VIGGKVFREMVRETLSPRRRCPRCTSPETVERRRNGTAYDGHILSDGEQFRRYRDDTLRLRADDSLVKLIIEHK
jgi:hypothetical protein